MTTPANTPGTPKDDIRAMRILCIALMAGALVFALMVIVLNQVSGPAMPEDGKEYNEIFLYVAIGIAVILLLQAIRLYSKKIAVIKDSTVSLREKLNQYRAALILYMALCEMPALFSIIVFFMTGNYIVLAVTGVMLVAMLLRMPQKKKIANELALNFQEQQELE
jgi:hypothetical protein